MTTQQNSTPQPSHNTSKPGDDDTDVTISRTPGTDGLRLVNKYPDDAEWTAHINILNDWTGDHIKLRSIIQYARSGPFYPADMHVDLIEQLIHSEQRRLLESLKADVHKRNNGLISMEAGLTRKQYDVILSIIDAALDGLK